MSLYKIYIALVVLVTLSTGIILAVNPSYADFLFDEYGIIESSGIVIAGLVFILALVLTFIGYRKRGVWRFWLGLSFLSAFFIGESLSWGEKFFNFKVPVIGGIRFDAAHDILSVTIGVMKYSRDFVKELGILDPKSIAIILGFILPIVFLVYFGIKILTKHKKDIKKFFSVNLRKPPFLFMFIALVLILIALIIDDDNLVGFPHKEIVDEALEFLGMIAFLFSSICGFIGKKWGFSNP